MFGKKYGKIRKMVMMAIEDRIQLSEEEYDTKCGKIEDDLIERIEEIRLQSFTEKESLARMLVSKIVGK